VTEQTKVGHFPRVEALHGLSVDFDLFGQHVRQLGDRQPPRLCRREGDLRALVVTGLPNPA
jgi:hypothetical protein